MSDHIYKKIELVGSSPNGIEDAVNNAISRAGKTIRNMSWFEVEEEPIFHSGISARSSITFWPQIFDRIGSSELQWDQVINLIITSAV